MNLAVKMTISGILRDFKLGKHVESPYFNHRGGYACPTRKGRTQACVPWVKWSNAQRKRAFSGSIKPFFGQKTARFSGKSGKIKKRRTQISKVPNAERTQTQNARF